MFKKKISKYLPINIFRSYTFFTFFKIKIMDPFDSPDDESDGIFITMIYHTTRNLVITGDANSGDTEL